MDASMIKKQAVKFNRARSNLLAVVVLTAVNLLLITFDVNFHFFFSAFVPQVVLIFLEAFFGSVGVVVAFLSVAIYLVCYALSKRWRVFMLIALILFALDALFMFGTMLYWGEFADFIFNVVFHIWILFYLITGTVAWGKLRRVTPDELQTLQQAVTQDAQTEELNSALDTITPPRTQDGVFRDDRER